MLGGKVETSSLLTTEAHGGEFAACVVGVDHHHAGAVVPLHLEPGRAADQVHVARVVDLKAVLFKTRLGVARVHEELVKDSRCQIFTQSRTLQFKVR